MAEIVGFLITVALCASISAVLYFVSIGLMVYFRARKEGLSAMPPEEILPLREVLKDAHLIIPIIALFYLLACGYSAIMAGLWALIGTVLITWVKPQKGIKPKQILGALIDGGKSAVAVAVACAATGMVVSVVTHTGLGLTFSNALVSVAKGNILIVMGLIMAASLILGHGAPTSATYVLIAAVGAQALVNLGADIIAAHLFCLYYAVIADITPPVAVAAYAAASLSESDPFMTGVEAFFLAAAGFIVPLVFVLQPALVLRGPMVETLQATITALIGVIALAGGLQGWFMANLKRYERLVLLIAALMLLDPHLITDVIGLAILGAFVIKVKLFNKHS